jgi:hypothetical protein
MIIRTQLDHGKRLFALFILLLQGATTGCKLTAQQQQALLDSAGSNEVRVHVPSSFVLRVDQIAKLFDHRDGQSAIELKTIRANPVCNPPDPCPGAFLQERVDIVVLHPGGCGPTADPSCLGPPGFMNNYSIFVGERIDVEVLGFALVLDSVTADNASFQILGIGAGSAGSGGVQPGGGTSGSGSGTIGPGGATTGSGSMALGGATAGIGSVPW